MKYPVDIEGGNAFVERLKARWKGKDKALTIGGFNGAFKIPDGYEEPVLISGTDGVGTKINICKIFQDWTTIGQDLVAMCVNDVICSGAKPLYFLDYISIGKLDHDILDQLMEGILKGCEIADMQLLGGETAEHPRPGPPPASAWDIDLAGFCTGVVEDYHMITGVGIKPGDKIIGIESSGIHSNGYSLINEMLWRQKIFYRVNPELMTPTTIYAPVVKELMEKEAVFGMAHITGGGIPGNLPRCLPEGLDVEVDYNSWPLPDIFKKIMLAGEIPEEEMKRTFNMGIGFCVIVPSWAEDHTLMTITPYHDCWTIGEVITK